MKTNEKAYYKWQICKVVKSSSTVHQSVANTSKQLYQTTPPPKKKPKQKTTWAENRDNSFKEFHKRDSQTFLFRKHAYLTLSNNSENCFDSNNKMKLKAYDKHSDEAG